jgi:hypothetical protein
MPAQSQIERSLSEIDFSQLTRNRSYHPSPFAWEDELLYFLFVDRFSDEREAGGFADLEGNPVVQSPARPTPLFEFPAHANTADWASWFRAGRDWGGGTLSGLQDKLGYIKRLGVTAVWLSPVFRQVSRSADYHGYGIQHFLDVDPHFGTRSICFAIVCWTTSTRISGTPIILSPCSTIMTRSAPSTNTASVAIKPTAIITYARPSGSTSPLRVSHASTTALNRVSTALISDALKRTPPLILAMLFCANACLVVRSARCRVAAGTFSTSNTMFIVLSTV